MRKSTIIAFILACSVLTGCAQIDALKDKIGGGGGSSSSNNQLSEANYSSSTYYSLKDQLGEDTLKAIRKVVKKKNETAFWDEYFYTVEIQVNKIAQSADLVDMINASNVSISYEPTMNTVTTVLSGLGSYNLPQDTIDLCYGQVTGDKENPYTITQSDITIVDSWFESEVFWKFWEDEDSKELAEEYISVIGDPYVSKAYTYKIAQKIFSAFQLLPEDYRDSKYLRIGKENEKYYVDFYTVPEGKDIPVTFHIMQIQVDTDELVNCLKGVDVEDFFRVDEMIWEVGGKKYSMNIDDYKDVSVNVRYNETVYLTTAINRLREAVQDEELRDKIIEVLNYVRDNIDSHHRIMLSLSQDYPEFEYLALQNSETLETTVFAVNRSKINESKSSDPEYLCNGTKLFVIDAVGKYRNYLNKAQNALYYDYYKWTLPPEDLGGDDEGNITDSKNPSGVVNGGDIFGL